jgi:PleD family two-component response regulator
VSYSAGIAMCRPGDETVSSMMVRADAAMYMAKGKGRGQTEILD